MSTNQDICLRNLHALVSELRVAVINRNGEEISELVDRYGAITDDLFRSPLKAGNPSQTVELRQLSEEIVRTQAEIQELAAPWVSDLRILLRENKTERALKSAYQVER